MKEEQEVKVVWHDLRDNAKDVPHVAPVYVCLDGHGINRGYSVAHWDILAERWVIHSPWWRDCDVIAWCELIEYHVN